MRELRTLHPPELFTPPSAFSHGVVAGDLVFVAGQVSFDSEMKVIATGDVAGQTRQVIANIAGVLNAAGATLADVVCTTVYLVGFDLYREFDAAYRECFGAHLPARATVRADLILPELLVEIQAIAARPRE